MFSNWQTDRIFCRKHGSLLSFLPKHSHLKNELSTRVCINFGGTLYVNGEYSISTAASYDWNIINQRIMNIKHLMNFELYTH